MTTVTVDDGGQCRYHCYHGGPHSVVVVVVEVAFGQHEVEVEVAFGVWRGLAPPLSPSRSLHAPLPAPTTDQQGLGLLT